MNYDIIGDIHGQADKLEALLAKLDYQKNSGAWRHPNRQAIFVGDFVDRGPAQVRTVETVRRMVECGAALAVMGNHGLNAIAWHTPDPRRPGEFLREHFGEKYGEKNRKQHARFLEEVEGRPLHDEIIDWFLMLPLWLDLPELRVVHACWHHRFIEWLGPQLDGGCRLNRSLMPMATQEPGDEAEKDNGAPTVFKAVEAVTKGIEIPLPVGHSFLDKDGFERRRVRVRWWDRGATTYRSTAMLPAAVAESLPALPIPEHAKVGPIEKPVFFGHYWLTGAPALESSMCACVDYSAGKGGPLVAYRFDGTPELSSEKLVWVE